MIARSDCLNDCCKCRYCMKLMSNKQVTKAARSCTTLILVANIACMARCLHKASCAHGHQQGEACHLDGNQSCSGKALYWLKICHWQSASQLTVACRDSLPGR